MHIKFKKAIFYLTIMFAVVIFAGLVFLIISRKDIMDIMFDSIVLLISAASVAIAFFAQLAADKEHRRLEKVIKNIHPVSDPVHPAVCLYGRDPLRVRSEYRCPGRRPAPGPLPRQLPACRRFCEYGYT